MKKNKKLIPLLCALICLLMTTSSAIMASSATSYTYAIDAEGDYVHTQDAYLPDRTITELQLNKPEDLFIDKEDYLYIADTGNKRIIKYDPRTDKVVMEISNEVLQTPRGLFVTQDLDIYVADTSASSVHHFSKDGELIESFTRPDAPAFGDNDFNPMKIGVDTAGNMFIQGEGIYDGLIQLAGTGEFLGFFASNRVSLSWVQKLQDLFFTEAQKQNLLGRTPITFSNVYVDGKGIVYSTTMGNQVAQSVKKHNTAGQNMIKERIPATDDMIDITVDSRGIIYSVSQSGLVFVYTVNGELIYVFGAFNPAQDVSGLFSSLSAVAVDSQGKIWTVDSEKSFIQSFLQTDYASKIYGALDAFNSGHYEESIDKWNGILKLNQMSVLAHNNIGKNYLFTQKYEEAMYHTQIAGNRYYYSQAYWEVRNKWLQANLVYVFILLIGLFVITKLFGLLDKRYKVLSLPKKGLKALAEIKPIKNVSFMFKFFRHPIDSFYDLKLNIQGSLFGAIFIYVSFFIIYIASLVGKGFIYQIVPPEDVDLQSVSLGFFIMTVLFVLCNFLVASIKDGEGNFTQLFKMMAYSLGPLWIALLIVTLSSHILTLNEVFILEFIENIGWVWTGVNLLLGVQETHNYETKDAIKSILTTLLFMVIIVVVVLIVVIMGEQLLQFFEAIIKEVVRNVQA